MSCYTHFDLAMVRSPRLRVQPAQQCRAFNARFHYGSAPEGLNQAVQADSQGH